MLNVNLILKWLQSNQPPSGKREAAVNIESLQDNHDKRVSEWFFSLITLYFGLSSSIAFS